jgi:hypothetical protein
MVSKDTVESAVKRFITTSDTSAVINRLRENLPKGTVLYLVGGAIRNLIIRLVFGSAPHTGDLDLFINGLPEDYALTGLLKGEVSEKAGSDSIVADISHLLRRIGKHAAYTMKFAYSAMREIKTNISQLSNRFAAI